MDKNNNCKKKYAFTLIRVFILLFIALMIPRVFFINTPLHLPTNVDTQQVPANTFKLGLENISYQFLQSLSSTKRLDYRVGLITNGTGLDQIGQPTIDVLRAKGLQIKKIFNPESDYTAYCNDLDVIIFDVQENGSDPLLLVNTLLTALHTAALYNKTLVILDRPNPRGPIMEGLLGSVELAGSHSVDIPWNHGMTCAELALYLNTTLFTKSARLYIVPMKQYTRSGTVISAYNSLLTNIDTCPADSNFLTPLALVFPFDVGINSSLGVSYLALPESLQIPKQKWFELRSTLKEQGIESSWYRYYHKSKQIPYAGLRLSIHTDHYCPFNTMITILQFFKEEGVKLTVSQSSNQLFTHKKMRDYLAGKCSRRDLEYEVNKGLKNFFNKAQSSFIYKPTPQIVFL